MFSIQPKESENERQNCQDFFIYIMPSEIRNSCCSWSLLKAFENKNKYFGGYERKEENFTT